MNSEKTSRTIPYPEIERMIQMASIHIPKTHPSSRSTLRATIPHFPMHLTVALRAAPLELVRSSIRVVVRQVQKMRFCRERIETAA